MTGFQYIKKKNWLTWLVSKEKHTLVGPFFLSLRCYVDPPINAHHVPIPCQTLFPSFPARRPNKGTHTRAPRWFADLCKHLALSPYECLCTRALAPQRLRLPARPRYRHYPPLSTGCCLPLHLAPLDRQPQPKPFTPLFLYPFRTVPPLGWRTWPERKEPSAEARKT